VQQEQLDLKVSKAHKEKQVLLGQLERPDHKARLERLGQRVPQVLMEMMVLLLLLL
jgi:hypothetical protein